MKKLILTIVFALLLINLTACGEESIDDYNGKAIIPVYVTNIGIFYKDEEENYYLYEMSPDDFNLDNNFCYYDADAFLLKLDDQENMGKKYVTSINGEDIYYYVVDDVGCIINE